MALSARLRSSLPLLQHVQRTTAVRPPIGNPGVDCATFALSEYQRGFATGTKPTEVNAKAPLTLFGGTGNYASALFLAAAKANVLDKVESEIVDVVEASKGSPLFSRFTKDLSIPRETRVKAVKEVFADAGFSDVTKNFLAVLADNGRLRYLERIANRFVDLTMAHRGE
ncbi:hypothetical protein HPP92_003415 [Vanilla planifolia]|uniref:ATP synthase subunit O, mitochondrial n=1 Tax=Vanilla planifolia TaxID=51239 RepID=A0A835SGM1_VANPL|nr:hypothetical protein HPP92_003415 [Vanilla planifolia]